MDFMKRLGSTLVDQGYSILPLQPSRKIPGTYLGSGWIGMTGWQQFGKRQPVAGELQKWETWLGAGIGIPCGRYVIGIDIDILDADLAAKVRALAFKHLGETSAVRIGLEPKCLLVYRPEGDIPSRKVKPIEILSHGAQFVGYGIHPDTGKAYQWVDENLADIAQDDLPAVTADQIETFLAAVAPLLPQQQTLKGAASPIHQGRASVHGLTAQDKTRIPDAVAAIPNGDLSWDEWNNIGMALWAATDASNEGLAAFHAFGAKSSKYDPAATDARWQHYFKSPPSSIGAGTIYELARRYGWTGDVTDIPVVDFSAFRAGLGQVEPPAPLPPPDPVPTGGLDGVLGLFVDWAVRTAYRPQPELAIAAGLAMIGALAGRKYELRGARTNIYSVGGAPSGSGKDHARRMVRQALTDAGLHQYEGGDEIASGAGLISAVERHPKILFQIDEFGAGLKAIANRDKAPRHAVDIMDKLTKLYSLAASSYYGTEYANQKERPRTVIHNPCVCLHGTTVPSLLWDALSSGSSEDGFLPRFLIFESSNHYPDIPQRLHMPTPDDLIIGLQAIAAGVPDHNAEPMGGGAMVACNPWPVEETPEARAALDALQHEELEQLRSLEAGSTAVPVWARYTENTIKVALVKAISASPSRPVVRIEDVEWAKATVQACMGTLLRGLEEHVADNQQEAAVKRLVRVLRKHGGWMSLGRRDGSKRASGRRCLGICFRLARCSFERKRAGQGAPLRCSRLPNLRRQSLRLSPYLVRPLPADAESVRDLLERAAIFAHGGNFVLPLGFVGRGGARH